MCGSWSVDDGEVGDVLCSAYTDYVDNTCTSDKEVKAFPLCSTFFRQSGQWGDILFEPLRTFIHEVVQPRSEALWNAWLKISGFFCVKYMKYIERDKGLSPLTL